MPNRRIAEMSNNHTYPDIYFFNPTCEPAIANGSPYYTAPALLRKFESDLGYLPGWLGDSKDLVLVQGAVDQGFSDRMKTFGFRLPGFLSLDKALVDPHWMGESKGWLRPWGWSPAVNHLFRNLVSLCQDDFRKSPVASWLPAHKNLYGRLTAAGLLAGLIIQSAEKWLPGLSELPVVCHSIEEIHLALSRHKRAVVKSPWSSSGRGLLLFPNVDTKKKNDEILAGMLNQQGFVTMEPWLDNVTDLSFQFYSQAGAISYKGRTFFETDRKGRYVRTFLGGNPILDGEVCQFVEEHSGRVVDLLLGVLNESDYSRIYDGWMGVDAMIYRTENGDLRFHPMIEINGRFTMAAVAMKMSEYLAPGSGGFMQIFYSKTGNFLNFCQRQEAEKSLVMEQGKILSGFLPLTPPLPEHHFGAFIEVTINKIPHFKL